VFQTVCLHLFIDLSRVRESGALQGWLTRVTTNKCYHWKRHQQNHVNGHLDQDGIESISCTSPIAAEVMGDLEREQLVRDCIEMLPARCRQMITLLFFQQPPQPY